MYLGIHSQHHKILHAQERQSTLYVDNVNIHVHLTCFKDGTNKYYALLWDERVNIILLHREQKSIFCFIESLVMTTNSQFRTCYLLCLARFQALKLSENFCLGRSTSSRAWLASCAACRGGFLPKTKRWIGLLGPTAPPQLLGDRENTGPPRTAAQEGQPQRAAAQRTKGAGSLWRANSTPTTTTTISNNITTKTPSTTIGASGITVATTTKPGWQIKILISSLLLDPEISTILHIVHTEKG